ncbi:hypothetical protein PL8927_610040 [Planktothrix serta PCC 8927]|uniref:Uncharacterized protein n=1 Tax=Planktothrix serta PCC 8927 TaxID=671068 RepID=A0A7Z9BTJ7_9CYAN|nr:hypothetical protein PL8927_610040 [Planktothrix serta PCC 8927]
MSTLLILLGKGGELIAFPLGLKTLAEKDSSYSEKKLSQNPCKNQNKMLRYKNVRIQKRINT